MSSLSVTLRSLTVDRGFIKNWKARRRPSPSKSMPIFQTVLLGEESQVVEIEESKPPPIDALICLSLAAF